MSKLTWLSGGNYNLDQCQTEDELNEKLNEVFEGLSEQLGDVCYRTDNGKQYVVGISVSVLEIEEEVEEEKPKSILN